MTRRPIWYEIGDQDFPSGWYWPGRFGDMYGPYDSREEAEAAAQMMSVLPPTRVAILFKLFELHQISPRGWFCRLNNALAGGELYGNENLDILIVEDSPADARLTEEAFRDARIVNSLHTVRDGEEALRYLRQEGEYASATRPHFVILDLVLPKIDGREVLAAMKSDAALRSIPVIVLSGTVSDDDIAAAYAVQASCVIRKPVDADQYFRAIRCLKSCGLTPSRCRVRRCFEVVSHNLADLRQPLLMIVLKLHR